MMHCFEHIDEGHGAAAINWKEPATSPGMEETVCQGFVQISAKSSDSVPL